MKDLQLSLKKNWFEITKSGIKTEDYREINIYWSLRLCRMLNGRRIRRFDVIEYEGSVLDFRIKNCTVNRFDSNIMTLGYPKSTDHERILKLEHKGIEVRTGNTEWGAEPDKLYFVIMHGNALL